MTGVAPTTGQTWTRNSTGETVEITHVGPAWETRRTVVVQGRRRVYCEYGPFLRKYTYAGNVLDGH